MDQAEIDAFWTDARIRAKLNRGGVYLGSTVAETVPPPVWAFGADPEQADELIALVLAGDKTATASARSEYADDGSDLPTPGGLAIVLDGAGHPRALIRTTDVAVVRFDEVDAAHARAEGEGDRSLGYWRAAHRGFFAEHGAGGFDETMLVVCERFRVLVGRDVGAPVREPAPV